MFLFSESERLFPYTFTFEDPPLSVNLWFWLLVNKQSTLRPSTLRRSTLRQSNLRPSTLRPSTLRPSPLRPLLEKFSEILVNVVNQLRGTFELKWTVLESSIKIFWGVNDPSGWWITVRLPVPVKLYLINHKNNNQLTLYTDYNLLIYKSEMSLICHPYTKEWTLEDHPTKC